NMWCGVFQEGGARFRLNKDLVPLELYPDGKGFICGPQRLCYDDSTVRWELDTPDSMLELAMKGHVTGDLWTGANDSVMSVATTGHYHFHCAVVGRVRLADETFEVSGHGWRDHSWGPRHWDSILHHRCFSGFFAGGVST